MLQVKNTILLTINVICTMTCLDAYIFVVFSHTDFEIIKSRHSALLQVRDIHGACTSITVGPGLTKRVRFATVQ